ncbi:SpoIIE family protein phosphatase [Streptomyces flaveolus]|uniref:SpoIIE family protein phosphatase n=1 Tax=Streptomyces flaveolus TaxID=67297 RepID=UPI0033AFC6B7
MGHGLESAVDMSAYRSSLRCIASADLPPHRCCGRWTTPPPGKAERRPATCLSARVDTGRGQVTLAGAGHLPPAAPRPGPPGRPARRSSAVPPRPDPDAGGAAGATARTEAPVAHHDHSVTTRHPW